MKDLMLDLETLGNRINPVIAQISAVQFDIETGETGKEFTINIDINCKHQNGLETNRSTIDWWSDQSIAAREMVFTNGVPMPDALSSFSLFIKSISSDDLKVWGNGIRADNVWLDSAYKNINRDLPFDFWQDSDVRTIVDLGKRIKGVDPKKTIPFEGVRHNAIDDCKHQIKYICEIYRHLKG